MQNRHWPKLGLPFITTRVSTDLVLFFVLWPLWTILGITQFLGPVLMMLLVFKLLIVHSRQKREIVIPFFLFSVMSAFLFFSLVSGLHIQEKQWNLVFLRNLALYIGALAVFIIVINITKDEADLLRIIKGLNFMVFLASLIGLAVILGIIPIQPGIVAPISHVLPERIRDSEFLYKTIHPALGDHYRLDLPNMWVRRINSLSPYANMFAAVLIILLPFQVFLFRLAKGWKRIWFSFNIGLVAINLLFTFSRSALISFLFGCLYFGFLNVKRFLGLLQRPLIIISLILLILLFLSVLREPVLVAKSSSSASRILIYQKTIESWRGSPVFGWGTERNMAVVGESPKRPPLGSHSYYLAILYRYGLVGLILFSVIIGLLFKEIKKIRILAANNTFLGKLGRYAGWAFVMIIIQSIFIVMDFDIVLLFLIWTTWGIIVAIRKMLEKNDSAGQALPRLPNTR
jgi:O-Antigen ligase